MKYSRDSELGAIQAAAREAGAGLWRDPVPEPPSVFRRAKRENATRGRRGERRSLEEAVNIGVLRKHIQHYFWEQTFNAIGQCYQLYTDAQAKVSGHDSYHKPACLTGLTLNRAALSKHPDTNAEIVKQDIFLAALLGELSQDEKRFRTEAEEIVKTMPEHAVYDLNRRKRLNEAYERSLGKWIDARGDLVLKHLRFTSNVPSHVIAIAQVVKRMKHIRVIYIALEIIIPVAFAIVSLGYVLSR